MEQIRKDHWSGQRCGIEVKKSGGNYYDDWTVSTAELFAELMKLVATKGAHPYDVLHKRLAEDERVRDAFAAYPHAQAVICGAENCFVKKRQLTLDESEATELFTM